MWIVAAATTRGDLCNESDFSAVSITEIANAVVSGDMGSRSEYFLTKSFALSRGAAKPRLLFKVR